MQMSSDAAAFPRETDASPSPGAFVRGTNVALKEGLCQCLRLVSRGVAGFVSGRLALGLGAPSTLLLVLLHGMSFTAAEIISLINSIINIIIFIVAIAIITVVDVSLSVN